MEKKFDSAEEIVKYCEKNKLPIEDIYRGYIHTMVTYLTENPGVCMFGASSDDFFIQGLISITANPEAFKSVLNEYLKNNDYVV